MSVRAAGLTLIFYSNCCCEQSLMFSCQPQYHNQILHGLWEVRLYDRQEAGHVR